MSKINNKKHRNKIYLCILLLAVADFILLLAFLLHGKNVAILNPKGFVAQEQFKLIIFSVIVLLTIAVPSLFLLYFTAWKYRESNNKNLHQPNIKHTKKLDILIWLVPSAFMLFLGAVMWVSTHKYVPQEPLSSTVKPMKIQVISMRWKWLFIYPDQNIATVNFVQIPLNTPVTFELTADEAPMSSFWIPNLGGQLYTMTSHVNRLNLVADTIGDYPGNSAEINGSGFSGMKFTARVSTMKDFNDWLDYVKNSPNKLGGEEYNKILEPSEDPSVAIYSTYTKGLYERVIAKYSNGSGGHSH